MRRTPAAFCVALATAASITLAQTRPTAVTISVDPHASQTFAGLGAGVGNWSLEYQKLSADERATLSRMLWHDLRMTSMRLWLNLDEYAPVPGTHRTADFRERYVDSGLIADARANGVTTLLLAPDGCPLPLKTKRDGGPNDFAIRDEVLAGYATVIADFIERIHNECGVDIDATGVQNEPNDLDRISPAQMPRIVKALRAELDARGLRHVAILAPESANVDDVYYETIAKLRGDADAWRALGGLAFHSYSMAATERAADGLDGKPFWMTEASANGPESPGDALRATSLAARFLGDVNHGATRWQHFLGFEVPDANDNATRILAYTARPLTITRFLKYDYYRALAETFDVGAVFRRATSDLDGDMAWTYGKKARITAAVARNADGSWAIGVANFTAPQFDDDPSDAAGYDNGRPARTFAVTIVAPEIVGDTTFAIRRCGATARPAEADVVMHAGQLTLPAIGPLELITARSR